MYCHKGKMVNILKAEEFEKLLAEAVKVKLFYEESDKEVLEYVDEDDNSIMVYWSPNSTDPKRKAIKMRFFTTTGIDTIDLEKIEDTSQYNGDYKLNLLGVWDESYPFGQYFVDIENRDLRMFKREPYGAR